MSFVTVLYEDKHAQGEKNYGPHMLVLACVTDQVGGDRHALRTRVWSIALGGDGNVKRKLRDDGAELAAVGPLIALFDHDKIRKPYGLPRAACKRDVLQAIGAEAKGAPIVVLLEQNMEDLVDACCAAMNQAKPAAKPRPIERDSILQKAAADGQRAARDTILAAMPSFRRLVDAVCRYVQAGEGTEP
jgi:hypothetical protein